jgi:hypothetical protein
MEQDLINYIEADPGLEQLLQSTESDSKVYPGQAPQGAEAPYILYNTISDGTIEENLLERSFSFNCVADTRITSNEVRSRLVDILDKQDQIRHYISSTTHWFYWSKHIGGSDFIDQDIGYYFSAATVDFKYAPVTVQDMEMIVKIIDKLGEYIDQGNPFFVADRPSVTIFSPMIASSVSSGSWVTLGTYTVTDKELWMDQITITGDVPCEVSVFVNTVETVPARTAHMDRTMNFQFKPAARMPIGTIIDIKIRHNVTAVAAEFKGCLNGHKY